MKNQEIKTYKETGEHSYHRRAFGHNYYAPFIYHVILKKAPHCEAYGHITGDARIAPGEYGSAKTKETQLGSIIAKALLHLQYEFNTLKLLQFCVMPDHVHILLQVLNKTDKHLDFYINYLKNDIAVRYSIKSGNTITDEDIFLPGYCDKLLYDNRSLDALYRYIRENPHRLAMRQQFPQFFRRIRKLKIQGEYYEAYGNLLLLRNPDKEAVKLSRKLSEDEKSQKSSEWISKVAEGTILVSPFISSAEKQVRVEAEKAGAKIILITHESFPELYKPSAHDFALCEQGRLLIISLGQPAKTAISRQLCLQMNDLAARIASGS